MLKALFAAAAFVVAASQPARASIVFHSFVDLGGTGLGTVATIVTVQDKPTESGCVAFGGVTGSLACFGTGNTGGDEKTGASQTQTRTILESGATSAAAFVLVLNAVEPDNSITLDSLSVRFYSPTGTELFTASLAAPVQFPDVAHGIGNSGFAFVLDSVQAAQAQAAGAFDNPLNVIGLSAGLSDADGGPETFFVGARSAVGVPFDVDPEPIPEPSTYFTLGAGLLMLGFSRRRLVRHREG